MLADRQELILHQLYEDTGCSQEDLPGAMDNRDECRERVRETVLPTLLDHDDDEYLYSSSTRMALALANPQRLICQPIKNPNESEEYFQLGQNEKSKKIKKGDYCWIIFLVM